MTNTHPIYGTPNHRLDKVRVTLSLSGLGAEPVLSIDSIHGESETTLGCLWSATPAVYCSRADREDYMGWVLEHLRLELAALTRHRPDNPRRAHYVLHTDGQVDDAQMSIFDMAADAE